MFKAPSTIPQDLLLIQELIADTTLDQRPAKKEEASSSDSDSSDSSSDSSSDISSSAESASDSDENDEAELVEELLVVDPEVKVESTGNEK